MLLNNTTYLGKTEHAFKWKYKSRADSTPLQMIKVTNFFLFFLFFSSLLNPLSYFWNQTWSSFAQITCIVFFSASSVFIYSAWCLLPLLKVNKWIHNFSLFFCLSVKVLENGWCGDEKGSWWTQTVKCREVLLPSPQNSAASAGVLLRFSSLLKQLKLFELSAEAWKCSYLSMLLCRGVYLYLINTLLIIC